jgi:hypothetical protein
LLALKRAEEGGGLIVRVQAQAGDPAAVKLVWFGSKIPLGKLKGGQIASWHLSRVKSRWRATRVDLAESSFA